MTKRKTNMKNKNIAISLIIFLLLGALGFGVVDKTDTTTDWEWESAEAYSSQSEASQTQTSISLDEIPEYTQGAYCEIDGNIPSFTDDELNADFGTEQYADLDTLGRCGAAFAIVGTETMPTEERGSIGSVHPSGWQLAKYDIVDGKYLYNRCHLIGYQLTAENANVKNLITGTRYLNVDGMLPFENEVADYVEQSGNHVAYKVVPIFEGDNLVASGVHMQAYSLEDNGTGVSFNVYCYNVQPCITIDYATGDSWLED